VIGKQDRWQEDLFVAGPLSSLIPEDHILKRVESILDLSWLSALVKDTYCTDNGRPSIDPESALRLMLAGFFEGIIQDRKLMRQAQVNLAIRWFAGYRLHESLPDHSSLTRIRQRWGEDRFKQIFQRIVQQCVDAGLVGGKTVHIDATLIRADVSWESLVQIHTDKVLEENPSTEDKPTDGSGRRRTRKPKPQKRSTTDPDASMTTSCRTFHMEPSYKQHGAVDDQCGIIVDIEVTTGQANEGNQLPQQIERIESNTGQKPQVVTADKGYAHGANYRHLEQEQIEAIIPPQTTKKRPHCIPSCRFKYDAKHRIVRCPAHQVLTYRSTSEKGDTYRADSRDCQTCPLRQRCFGLKARCRTILIVPGYEALLRARRIHARKEERRKALYTRHHWQVEGIHGQAKTQHGLRRAARRGLWNVAIQAYLTAVVMNLKRLAAVLVCFLRFWGHDFVTSDFQNRLSMVEKRNCISVDKILLRQAA
jgi:transposase